jgi:drug/metabolite transporter (DMT)-like permease
MLGSALAFSSMGAIVKSLGSRFPTAELLLARTLVSLVLSAVWLRYLGIAVWGTARGWLFLRGVLGFCGLACLFYALPRMPLAEATVIQTLYPMFTAVLAAVFLGEGLKRPFWAGTFLSLFGVVCIAQPSFLIGGAAPVAGVGLLAALGAAWFSACAYVLVRRLSQTEHPLVIVFYFPLVAMPATLPFVVFDAVMPQGWDWFWLLMIGVTTQFGQVWLTRGLQLVEASRATSIAYAQVAFAAGFGVLLFDEWPNLLSALGALGIVGGTWLIQRRGKS